MAIQKPPVAPLYFSVVGLLLLRSFLPLFRTGPVSFNFFQRLSGGFRLKFPDNQHIRHAHDGEQEGMFRRGVGSGASMGELSIRYVPIPQGKSCNGHGQSAHLGWDTSPRGARMLLRRWKRHSRVHRTGRNRAGRGWILPGFRRKEVSTDQGREKTMPDTP